jgi:PPOX class probable F420-dependent enzyme
VITVAPVGEAGEPGALVTSARETAAPGVSLDRRIRSESVLWLTTASADGRPHVVPTWFHWDGQTFLVFTKPEAAKARNIRSNPAVMLALGDPTADFDVLLIEGRAEVLDPPSALLVPSPFFDLYSERMTAIGLSRDDFVVTYSLTIRIRPTRYLGWAGRSHLGERLLQAPGTNSVRARQVRRA